MLFISHLHIAYYQALSYRYEFNNKYREDFINAGMTLCGLSPDGSLVEAVEITNKKFYVGVQYHPEFKSRPNRPHPLFLEFIKASLGDKYEN